MEVLAYEFQSLTVCTFSSISCFSMVGWLVVWGLAALPVYIGPFVGWLVVLGLAAL